MTTRDLIVDEDDLDTYATDVLRNRAVQTPGVRAELARRAAAEAARRRCPRCWHEHGTHADACSARSAA